jgi:hypothetical protein
MPPIEVLQVILTMILFACCAVYASWLLMVASTRTERLLSMIVLILIQLWTKR